MKRAAYALRGHGRICGMPLRLPTISGYLLAALVACVVIGCVATNLASNAMMMLLDRSNVIPEESSIFSFEPYVINQGSSNYWRYGKDRHHYYHFTYQHAAPYVYIRADNHCPGFDREDVRTWCSARAGAAR
jgi:hypothetical protein